MGLLYSENLLLLQPYRSKFDRLFWDITVEVSNTIVLKDPRGSN